MTFNWKREWIPIAAILGSFLASAALYGRLPEPMPIHWNAAGAPDNFGSRLTGAFLLPATSLGVYLLVFVLPQIDPRRANIERFIETYRFIRTVIVLFLTYFHGVVLYAVVRGDQRLSSSVITAGVGIFFVVLGNYLPRVRSNWFMGIRTPWTLSSEQVWRATHRLAGRLFVVAGLATLFLSFFRAAWTVWGTMGSLLLAGLVPIVYSYLRYRQEHLTT